MDLGGWLRSLGLGKYEAAFRDNEIDETVLPSLTEEHLKQLGVTALGHRLKLLDAIAALRGDESQHILSAIAAPARPSAATTTAAHVADSVGERRYLTIFKLRPKALFEFLRLRRKSPHTEPVAIRSRRPRGHCGTDIAGYDWQAERRRGASHGRGKAIGSRASLFAVHRSDPERTRCISAESLLRCV